MATSTLRGFAGALLSAAVFCLVLGLACCGLRRGFEALPDLVLEEPGPPALKLQHLRAHGDEIELLFLGSSRVFRQLNPTVFDAQLAERGLRLRSYNLGLPGMRFYEQLYLIDRLLAERPPALRWLLIELGDPDPGLEDANLLTRRSIEWHSTAITWLVLRNTWASDRALVAKLEATWSHLQGAWLRGSNAGLGVPALVSLIEPAPVQEDESPAGFLPLEFDPNRTTAQHRREFLTALAAEPRLLEQRVREIRQPAVPPAPGALLAGEMRALVARLEHAGIEPLFFLSPPAERSNADWRALRAAGVLPNLFALDDPEQNPDFYLDPSIRFDLNHMDRTGGNRMTRLLAQEVAEHLLAEREH